MGVDSKNGGNFVYWPENEINQHRSSLNIETNGSRKALIAGGGGQEVFNQLSPREGNTPATYLHHSKWHIIYSTYYYTIRT